MRAFAEAACPTILIGVRAWDPAWSREVPLLVDAVAATPDERGAIWRAALLGIGDGACPDPARSTGCPSGSPRSRCVRAARSATLHAAAAGRDARAGRPVRRRPGPERGRPGAAGPPDRAGGGLGRPRPARTDRRASSASSPPGPATATWSSTSGGWAAGRRRGAGSRRSSPATRAPARRCRPRSIAGELGLDLYVIDLSTVVDKYIGETEKNLDRIFTEADRVNGVLLFDEADAIFGKRSEVKDARDRYANVEVAYLLQRMELFDGLAILTTNLRANVDEAFIRRLDAIVDFPMPEEEDRLPALADATCRRPCPRADDLDLDFLARAFKLVGRQHPQHRAWRPPTSRRPPDRPVSMADLIRATEREYRKLGRLVVEAEFGAHFRTLADNLGGSSLERDGQPSRVGALAGANGPIPGSV